MNGPIDECVADLKTVVKAWQDQAADVIDIKISKFGGITKESNSILLHSVAKYLPRHNFYFPRQKLWYSSKSNVT